MLYLAQIQKFAIKSVENNQYRDLSKIKNRSNYLGASMKYIEITHFKISPKSIIYKSYLKLLAR